MKKKKTLIICMILGIMLDFLRKNRSSGSGVRRHRADIQETAGKRQKNLAETVGGSEESTEATRTAQARSRGKHRIF